MLRILLALHQAAPLERRERQLHALRADQQPTREFGTGQPGLVGELAQHTDLRGADAVFADRVVDRGQREVEGLLEQPQDVVGEFHAHSAFAP